ncbi:MAG: peroxiredoxin [Planctomycetes bacterium]|nr:peroxiredoxin [Planctomycetota bacterium]
MRTVAIAILIGFACLAPCFAQDPTAAPKVGATIPAFNANDDQGNLWQSSAQLGKDKVLVVYFYPAALTGGCTRQACTYRDRAEDLKRLNINVVGVSGDPVNNLKLFKQAHALNFPLISDVNGFVAKLFGVPARKGGTFKTTVDNTAHTLARANTPSRWTFILDSRGKIVYKNTQVNAQQDTAKVIGFIQGLQ